jgi:hypothetical protein
MILDQDGQRATTRVMIGVPCGGEDVKADFAMSLALMMSYTTYVRPDIELPLFLVKGTYLPRARAALVNAALEQSCSHILWVDADMRFPKDALVRLLSHGVPVVAANYPTRQMPIEPTARDMQNQPVFVGEGLVDVRACGMGLMLTDVDVFRAIGKPYFALGYNKTTDDYAGEDTYFCERARVHGYRVQVDMPLSEHVEHCGGLRYTMAHARLTLDAAPAAGVIGGP